MRKYSVRLAAVLAAGLLSVAAALAGEETSEQSGLDPVATSVVSYSRVRSATLAKFSTETTTSTITKEITSTITIKKTLPLGNLPTKTVSSSIYTTTQTLEGGPYEAVFSMDGKRATAISVPGGVALGSKIIPFGASATISGYVVKAETWGVVAHALHRNASHHSHTATRGPHVTGINNGNHGSNSSVKACFATKVTISYLPSQPGAIIIVKGKTLSPGGPAMTACGKTVSQDSKGALVANGKTVFVPTVTRIKTYSGSKAPGKTGGTQDTPGSTRTGPSKPTATSSSMKAVGSNSSAGTFRDGSIAVGVGAFLLCLGMTVMLY